MSAPAPIVAADEESLWTVREVAKLLKTSRSWVYKNAERDLLPCVRIGNLLRFEPAAIKAWIAAKRCGGGEGR